MTKKRSPMSIGREIYYNHTVINSYPISKKTYGGVRRADSLSNTRLETDSTLFLDVAFGRSRFLSK